MTELGKAIRNYNESRGDAEIAVRDAAVLAEMFADIRKVEKSLLKEMSTLRAEATKEASLGYKAERMLAQGCVAGIAAVGSTLVHTVDAMFDMAGVLVKHGTAVATETATEWQKAGWRYDVRNSKEFRESIAALGEDDRATVQAWMSKYAGVPNSAAAKAPSLATMEAIAILNGAAPAPAKA